MKLFKQIKVKSNQDIIDQIMKQHSKWSDKLVSLDIKDNANAFYIMGVLGGLLLARRIVKGEETE